MKKIITLLILIILIFSNLIIQTNGSQLTIRDDNGNKRYAIIMVGSYIGTIKDITGIEQYYEWYLNDAGKMYKTLRDVYGFDEEDIFLLAKKNSENLGFEVADQFDFDWVDYESNEANLKIVLDKCKTELNHDDTLFFCMINHGGSTVDGGVNWEIVDDALDGSWESEELAFDQDTETSAFYNKDIKSCWSEYITLTTNEYKDLRGFRISANNHIVLSKGSKPVFDLIEINFYKDESFINNVTLNYWPSKKFDKWQYFRFEDDEFVESANKIKIRFHEDIENFGFKRYPAELYEFDLWPYDYSNPLENYDITDTFFQFPFLNITSFVNFLTLKPGPRLDDTKLKEYMNGINAKMIIILQPCRAGGFIDDLSRENRIILSASRGAELSPSGWIGYVRKALSKVDSNNDGIYDADTSPTDGNISLLETYIYATEKVLSWINRPGYENTRQHPLIDDNGDGIGHYISETDFCKNGGDGLVASEIFLNYIGQEKPLEASIDNEKLKLNTETEIDFLGSAKGGKPRYNYKWDFGDGSTSTDQDPEHVYKNDGSYIVTFTVYDEKGNSNTDSKTFEISKTKTKTIFRFSFFFRLIEKLRYFDFLNP